jgi:phosphate transport system permease protein
MVERLFAGVLSLNALLVVLALGWVLADVALTGISHFSWAFLSTAPQDSGRSGGIFPILVSTLVILLIALIVALPLGVGVAVWLAEMAPTNSRVAALSGMALDILAGVPSIVYGLFGHAFFCLFLGLGFSLLAGGLTLACMILPVLVRTCEMGLRAVDDGWRQGALALGMTRTAAIWHVLLPAATPALVTGLVLGMGRATAETAALLFTSGYVDRMPESWLDSGRALAVHIYDLSMNITGGDRAAYASAWVLIVLIVVMNSLAHGLLNYWLKRRLVAL